MRRSDEATPAERLVLRTTAAQNLPLTVTNADTLALIATAVLPARGTTPAGGARVARDVLSAGQARGVAS